jgi:homoserine O-acetyltransferase
MSRQRPSTAAYLEDQADLVEAVPVTGAWRPGDPPGRRRFTDVGSLPLESGERLPDVRLAYETWGTLSPSGDNAVLVLHALTGDSHVVGEAGPGHPTPGWWQGLIGPGRPLDTDHWFVVAPNVLGGCQGTTGPSSAAPDGRPWGSRFPFITVRDQVAAEVALADRLGIDRWALVAGGSMGGMRALEWAVTVPDRRASAAATTTTRRRAVAPIWGSAWPAGSRTSPTGPVPS